MLHTGRMLINLKRERSGTQQQIIERLRERAPQVAGVAIYLQPTQDLTIDAESGPTQYRVSLEGADNATVTQWATTLAQRLQRVPQVRNVVSDAGATGSRPSVDIDRDTASRLGISAASVDDALYSAFGQRIVSTIFTETNQYRVILEARPDLLTTPESLGLLHLTHRLGRRDAAVGDRRDHRAAGAAAGDARGAVPGHHARLRHRAGRVAGQAVDAITQAAADAKLPPA
jgi:multidrug efflux pump